MKSCAQAEVRALEELTDSLSESRGLRGHSKGLSNHVSGNGDLNPGEEGLGNAAGTQTPVV
jgi:hypothetical protein